MTCSILKKYACVSQKKKQSGAVLVMALVLMAILASYGIMSMRNNVTDVGIHKNMKSRANAFQCAEAALRAGEIWIDKTLDALPEVVTTKPTPGTLQVWDYKAAEVQDIFYKNDLWWVTNGWTYGTDLIHSDYEIGCAEQPRFIVERLGTTDDGSGSLEIKELSTSGIDYYRVTAYSVGIKKNAAVILQSTFAKRLR